MYKNILIERFRGIEKLSIDNLSNINIFIGENNTGKTSVLEALFLLTGGTNVNLPVNINRFRNSVNYKEESYWNAFFHKLEEKKHIKFKADLEKGEKRELEISSHKREKISIENEEIYMEELAKKSGDSVANMITNGLLYHFILTNKKGEQKIDNKIIVEPINKKMNTLQITQPKDYVEHLRGKYLSNYILGNIKADFDAVQTNKKTDEFLKIVRDFEPRIKNIVLSASREMLCDVEGFDKLIPLKMMGNGTVHFCAIVLAILEGNNRIIFIDEVENGLHHKTLNILWQGLVPLIKEYNIQAFITTHSLEAVRAIMSANTDNGKNLRLYRLEKEDRGIKSVSYDYDDLRISLEKNWEIR